MITTILTISFALTVLAGAVVGLIRGMEKATIRLITLLLAAVLTFVVSGPVAKLIAGSIRLGGMTLGEMLLESLMNADMVGRIIQAAPLMQEAILVAPVFLIAIPVFSLVFQLLKYLSLILHRIICKPLQKLFFGRGGEEKPAVGTRLGKRFAGLAIGVLTGMVIFAVTFAPVFGLFSMLPDPSAANQTVDAMVEQQLLAQEDADLVREAYAVTDCTLVKAHRAMGVNGMGRNYLNSVSKIEAEGQTTYLADEFDSLLAVAQTAVEGGLVEALMDSEDQTALYAVLADPVFVNDLMQDMVRSKLLRAAAPEVMTIALESVTQSMNLPISKDAVYNKMMDSIAQAVRQADVDYALIAEYERLHGLTRSAVITDQAYQAEIQKRDQLEKKISSILNRAVAGDNKAFTDSLAAQLVQQIQTQAVSEGQAAVIRFVAADVQEALAELDAATLTAGEADAAQLLEQLQDVEKFTTDLETAEAIVEKITQSLQGALGDDAKSEQTAQALANIISGLVGIISDATDEQGNLNMDGLDFGKIGDVVTELQNSPLKDVGSALLDMVISSDLGENELVGNVMSAVQEGYENGEDIGNAIETVGALVDLGAAMGGRTENDSTPGPGSQPGSQPGNQPGNQSGSQPGNQSGSQPGNQSGSQQEAVADSLTSLIENLDEFTISLLPSIFTTDTITSMGIPAEYAAATYDMVETLLTELMALKGAADYDHEVDAILHLYDLATTGVESFTEEDVPELINCAMQSDAIYNTITSVSNPFGVKIPDEATRTRIADAIEEYYNNNSGHTARERALYQAVASLLGLDGEVNLGA